MGRPPGRPPKIQPDPKQERVIRDLEEENIGLQRRIERLQTRYIRLRNRTIELVLGDLSDDEH